MDFKSERWSSFQSNHFLGFPWLHYHLQKLSVLPDLLLYTMNYPYLSPSRRFILHFENLLPLLSITSTLVAFNKTDSPTKLRKSLKKHTQGTSFGYVIDLKGKFKSKFTLFSHVHQVNYVFFSTSIKIVGG